MRLSHLHILVFIALALPGAAIAQGTEGLVTVFDAGMSAFQRGDYQTAVSKLQEVISQAPPEAKLEPVYFTLGASYYNLQQYPEAIETFNTYLAKYPQGARVQDAIFSLGQAAMITKDYNTAAEQFGKLANAPQFREQALCYRGYALDQAGKLDDGIEDLTTLISPEIRTAMQENGAMMLVDMYRKKKEGEKANDLIGKILSRPQLVENMARLNALAVELADSYLDDGKDKEALAVYRTVKSRDEVIKFQADRVAAIQKVLDDTINAMRADPRNFAQYIGRINQIRGLLDDSKKVLDEANKMPEFTSALYLRIARAYYNMGRRWEAAAAYEEMLNRFPDAKERETAMYAEMATLAELNRPAMARDIGEQYLKEFPQGKNAQTVGYLMGATALQANDPQGADTYFGRTLQEQPNSSYREEMRFLLGNAKFAQGKFDDAIQCYQQYQKDFPQGTHSEEAQYRIAAAMVFGAKYEKAIPMLNQYIQSYPQGTYVSDARYRIAVCYYAASQYDDVIARCQAWEKDYPHDQQLGEVLALEADSQAAKGDNDDAIDNYILSYKAATTDEVLNYSLFEAQKGLQKKGDWDRMSDMFQKFVKDHPDHAAVPMAMYWIGKAKAREGKVDEARQFLAANIRNYINDPRKEATEQLLTQLALLCAHRQPPALAEASPAAGGTDAVTTGTEAVATATVAATPEPTPEPDPAVELDSLLAGDAIKTETAKARMMFVRSELARFQRKPDEQAAVTGAIAHQFKPEDLSPMLLAQSGDYLFGKGEIDQAAALYQYLMDNYPKSNYLEFAYNGLGQIALVKKDNEKALSLFTDAIDNVGAVQKLKDVTIGKAKALLALGKLDDAQKVFEQVASMREWRGEPTAFAVYSLGEIQFQQNKWADANAYYQHVYVAYQRYLPWVAKAYIKSGECFQKLGKVSEAVKTYQEMLRNDKLDSFQEATEARKKLQELGMAQG